MKTKKVVFTRVDENQRPTPPSLAQIRRETREGNLQRWRERKANLIREIDEARKHLRDLENDLPRRIRDLEREYWYLYTPFKN